MATLGLPTGAKAIIQSLVNCGFGAERTGLGGTRSWRPRPSWRGRHPVAVPDWVHHALHEGGQGGGGLGRDGLQPRLGRVGLHQVALGVPDLGHHVGGHLHPLVGHRAGHHGHLQGRGDDVLLADGRLHDAGDVGDELGRRLGRSGCGRSGGRTTVSAGTSRGIFWLNPYASASVDQGLAPSGCPIGRSRRRRTGRGAASRVPPHRPRRGSWSAPGAGCRCWAR